jgi:hypothetical protein
MSTATRSTFPSLPAADAGKDCLEGPLMGTQIGDGQNDLDGNWGFGEIMFDELGGLSPKRSVSRCLPAHYLVEVVIPDDASGNPHVPGHA